MAVIDGLNGIAASPNSSEEVDSHHGTPATKLSPFSQENVHDFKAGGHGIARSNVPPAFNLVRTNTNFSPKGKAAKTTALGSQDPFVSAPALPASTRTSSDASKLSPAALNFTPASSHGFSSGHEVPVSASIRQHIAGVPVLLALPPVLQTFPNHATSTNRMLSGPPGADMLSPGILSPSSMDGFGLRVGELKNGQFSSDGGVSRALMISQITPGTSVKDIQALFNTKNFPSLKFVVLAELAPIGAVYVKFEDIRDADRAHMLLKTNYRAWISKFIEPKEFALKHQPESLKNSQVSMFEGQVIVTAQFAGPFDRSDGANIGAIVEEALGNIGHLLAFELVMVNYPTVAYRAEFVNATTVNKALDLNGHKGCTLSISLYKPDVESTAQRPSKVPGPLIIGRDTGLEKALVSMSVSNHRDTYGPQTPRTPSFLQFPISTPGSRHFTNRNTGTGQNTPSSFGSYTHGFPSGVSDRSSCWSPTYNPYANYAVPSPLRLPYGPGAIGQERGVLTLPHDRQGNYGQRQNGQGMIGGRQHVDYASGHHNVVDINRIGQGIDIRTTIMLRNIPNKVDLAMLKKIVNETSFGKYDFMYLRIDFANNCNVGYAFINFEDPYSIIEFVNARAGHRWNCYNSDKVAEVSYATIQGRDCLIQKFRNSSVMLEYPEFRPKLFRTGTGPDAGQEELFPPPDNQTKFRRSIENAEHVGLFAPRAGQNFRGEQRRRRSQYDRGTRLAEIEDSYEDNHYDNRNGPNAFHVVGPYGRMSGPHYPGVGGSSFQGLRQSGPMINPGLDFYNSIA